MALSPAVPIMAPGELITSSRANAVRSNLDRIDNRITPEINAAVAALQTRQAQAGPFANVIAGANNDTTTAGAFATWLTVTSVLTAAPPSWATAGTITIHVTNVQALTADSVYSFTATLGGGSYGTTAHGSLAFTAANQLGSFSFVVPLSSLAGLTGPQVVIGARREAGTGIIRATAAARASAQVLFR